jgi:hypothetical protein
MNSNFIEQLLVLNFLMIKQSIIYLFSNESAASKSSCLKTITNLFLSKYIWLETKNQKNLILSNIIFYKLKLVWNKRKRTKLFQNFNLFLIYWRRESLFWQLFSCRTTFICTFIYFSNFLITSRSAYIVSMM